jgi:putative hemolysin
MITSFLSLLPGSRELARLYECCLDSMAPADSFESRALDTLEIAAHVEMIGAHEIPDTGPLSVAANHPTGMADGLVLIDAIRRTRRDVRIVANHLLACIPEMRDVCMFIDPFGGTRATSRNVPGLRAAHNWLRRGGSILLFPAGEVASGKWFETMGTGQTPVDSRWYPTLGRLALATRAQVVPAFLSGRNSIAFYAAGMVHPMLRTLLLGRELLHQRGKTLSIRFGAAVPFDRIRELSSADQVTEFIRGKTEALARPSVGRARIAPAQRWSLLAQEVASLPSEAKLLTSGTYDVFCTASARIPNLLTEIGRLREITFRAVGEGTGHSRDTDRFDVCYDQLFVWDRARSEIVGAYRIGATDRIVPASGVAGLYTSTLFEYEERLFDQIGPALELGRSFVRPEYQRSHSPLLLLWKGIGEMVRRSPRYRVLFGAVSISNRYRDTSRALMRTFLSQHRISDFARLVHGMNPPPIVGSTGDLSVGPDVDDLDSLIRGIEGNHGIPVLLRQYLRLNATLLGFNIDRAFGDALDALMMVDLATLPAGVLGKYLGRNNAQTFLDYHARTRPTPQRAA